MLTKIQAKWLLCVIRNQKIFARKKQIILVLLDKSMMLIRHHLRKMIQIN